jgi:hypothetical protein
MFFVQPGDLHLFPPPCLTHLPPRCFFLMHLTFVSGSTTGHCRLVVNLVTLSGIFALCGAFPIADVEADVEDVDASRFLVFDFVLLVDFAAALGRVRTLFSTGGLVLVLVETRLRFVGFGSSS